MATVTIEQLRKYTDALLDHVAEHHGETIEIETGYYWDIEPLPTDNFETRPEVGIGDIDWEIEFLDKIITRDYVISYNLVSLGNIFRIIGSEKGWFTGDEIIMKKLLSVLFSAVFATYCLSGCGVMSGMNLDEIISCKDHPWYLQVRSDAQKLTPENYSLERTESQCTSNGGTATYEISTRVPAKDFDTTFSETAVANGWTPTISTLEFRQCIAGLDTLMYVASDEGVDTSYELVFDALNGNGDRRCSQPEGEVNQ